MTRPEMKRRASALTLLSSLCFTLLSSLCFAACTSEGSSTLETVLDEASRVDATSPSDSFTGLWRTSALFEVPDGPTAHIDLIWVVGETDAWHVVIAYADEAQTVPLVRWDVVRSYTLGSAASISATATQLDWQDLGSTLTIYVDDPALLAAIGLDDCAFEPGVPFDASANCGAPLFPAHTCVLMDFADIDDNMLTFGNPQGGDRCTARSSMYEGWTFARVPLEAGVRRVLDARSPMLDAL